MSKETYHDLLVAELDRFAGSSHIVVARAKRGSVS
jgi:hypothetical protein